MTCVEWNFPFFVYYVKTKDALHSISVLKTRSAISRLHCIVSIAR